MAHLLVLIVLEMDTTTPPFAQRLHPGVILDWSLSSFPTSNPPVTQVGGSTSISTTLVQATNLSHLGYCNGLLPRPQRQPCSLTLKRKQKSVKCKSDFLVMGDFNSDHTLPQRTRKAQQTENMRLKAKEAEKYRAGGKARILLKATANSEEEAERAVILFFPFLSSLFFFFLSFLFFFSCFLFF